MSQNIATDQGGSVDKPKKIACGALKSKHHLQKGRYRTGGWSVDKPGQWTRGRGVCTKHIEFVYKNEKPKNQNSILSQNKTYFWGGALRFTASAKHR